MATATLICRYCAQGEHALHFVEYRDADSITRICRCHCPLGACGNRRNETAAEMAERRMQSTAPLATPKESWL